MSTQAISPEKIDLIVDSITTEMRGQLGKVELPTPVEVERTSRALVSALTSIRKATGQAPALRALLEGARSLGARAAVFVLRGEHVELWESQGFGSDLEEKLAGARVEASDDAIAGAIAKGSMLCGPDGVKAPSFGQGEVAEAQLDPIRVQGKVVGLLYADCASDESARDALGIQVLAEFTGLAVEGLALLRALGQDLSGVVENPAGPVEAAVPAVEAAVASTEPAPVAAPLPAAQLPVPELPAPELPAPESLTPVPAMETADSAAAEDARRFARLLMEEICLYNGDKVEAGRTGKDLLARLGDEIEQARAMYTQRVPGDVSSKGDYFEEAMVQVLAGGDRAVL